MHSRSRGFITFFSIFLALFIVVGCAGKADKELSDAEAARQKAIEEGAQDTEAFREAEELIARAKELMSQGKHNEARGLLEEARFKYIQALGEKKSEQYVTGMTEADREIQGEILSRQRPELQPMVQTTAGGIEDIFFDFDKAEIRSDARITLNQNAGFIKNNAAKYKLIAIEGYCDTRGTEEYNLALGQRRADSAKSYLVGLGISPALIQAVSKGETEQWAPGTSEYAYQQNRRAHFKSVK